MLGRAHQFMVFPMDSSHACPITGNRCSRAPNQLGPPIHCATVLNGKSLSLGHKLGFYFKLQWCSCTPQHYCSPHGTFLLQLLTHQIGILCYLQLAG